LLANATCTATPRRWGLGPTAQAKKKLIAEGKLDKFGKPNEKTPVEYLRAVPDLGQAGAKKDAGAGAAAEAAVATDDKKRERSPTSAADDSEKKKKKEEKSAKKEKKEKKDKKDKKDKKGSDSD
jgi:H/ACA ribonucleoprotein complex subunit 4